MIYILKTREEKPVNRMVRHILNKGFVEKFSSEFCEKYGIYYTLSPSYISFVDLCTYLMKEKTEIDIKFIFNNNYEEVFKLFSTDFLNYYKEVKRYEYIHNFKIDGEYIDPKNIEKSRNELKANHYNVEQSRISNKR